LNKISNNTTIRQFFRFCVVGSLGASINYCVFYILYKVNSIHYVVSSLIGFFVSATFIFIINRQWTFCVRHGHITKQFIYFNALIGFSFVVNGIVIYFFTKSLHIIPEVSQLAAMTVTTIINFSGSKIWVFRNV
jgi:putative flippase GtrA|tara:strand:+ start:703 stop:1104 length:402 start_codon:yes stop_codon:yes gene_type:complete